MPEMSDAIDRHGNTTTQTSSRRAAGSTYYNIANTLLGLDSSSDLDDIFIAAARDGDCDRIENFLLRRNEALVSVDVKDRKTGNTALIWAAKRGHTKIVQLLLKNGADVTLRNFDSQTAVEIASPAIKTMLLDFVDRSAETSHRLLLQASWQGNIQVVRKLLRDKKGLDINCQNEDGLTPLLLASRDLEMFEKLSIQLRRAYNPAEVVADLLKYRVDVHASDSDGKTCLHYASQSKAANAQVLVNKLLNAGSDMGMQDKRCFTPIHCASLSGNVDVVVSLLDGGSDVNSRGFAGATPLHVTSIYDHERAAATLLEHGADVTITDDRGFTAIDVAKSKRMKVRLREAWSEATQSRQQINLAPLRAPSMDDMSRLSMDNGKAEPKMKKGEVIFDGLTSSPTSSETIRAFPSRTGFVRQISNAEKAARAERQMARDLENRSVSPTLNLQDSVRRLGILRNPTKVSGMSTVSKSLEKLPPVNTEKSSVDSPIFGKQGNRNSQEFRRASEDRSSLRNVKLATFPVGDRTKKILSIDNNEDKGEATPRVGCKSAGRGHRRSGSDPFQRPTMGEVAASCGSYMNRGRSVSLSTQPSKADDDVSNSPTPRLTAVLTPGDLERAKLRIPATIKEGLMTSINRAMILDLERMHITNNSITPIQGSGLYPTSGRVLPPTPTFYMLQSYGTMVEKATDLSPESEDGVFSTDNEILLAVKNPYELLRSKSILKEEFIIADSRPKDPFLCSSGSESSDRKSSSDPASSLSSVSSESPREDVFQKIKIKTISLTTSKVPPSASSAKSDKYTTDKSVPKVTKGSAGKINQSDKSVVDSAKLRAAAMHNASVAMAHSQDIGGRQKVSRDSDDKKNRITIHSEKLEGDEPVTKADTPNAKLTSSDETNKASRNVIAVSKETPPVTKTTSATVQITPDNMDKASSKPDSSKAKLSTASGAIKPGTSTVPKPSPAVPKTIVLTKPTPFVAKSNTSPKSAASSKSDVSSPNRDNVTNDSLMEKGKTVKKDERETPGTKSPKTDEKNGTEKKTENKQGNISSSPRVGPRTALSVGPTKLIANSNTVFASKDLHSNLKMPSSARTNTPNKDIQQSVRGSQSTSLLKISMSTARKSTEKRSETPGKKMAQSDGTDVTVVTAKTPISQGNVPQNGSTGEESKKKNEEIANSDKAVVVTKPVTQNVTLIAKEKISGPIASNNNIIASNNEQTINSDYSVNVNNKSTIKNDPNISKNSIKEKNINDDTTTSNNTKVTPQMSIKPGTTTSNNTKVTPQMSTKPGTTTSNNTKVTPQMSTKPGTTTSNNTKVTPQMSTKPGTTTSNNTKVTPQMSTKPGTTTSNNTKVTPQMSTKPGQESVETKNSATNIEESKVAPKPVNDQHLKKKPENCVVQQNKETNKKIANSSKNTQDDRLVAEKKSASHSEAKTETLPGTTKTDDTVVRMKSQVPMNITRSSLLVKNSPNAIPDSLANSKVLVKPSTPSRCPSRGSSVLKSSSDSKLDLDNKPVGQTIPVNKSSSFKNLKPTQNAEPLVRIVVKGDTFQRQKKIEVCEPEHTPIIENPFENFPTAINRSGTQVSSNKLAPSGMANFVVGPSKCIKNKIKQRNVKSAKKEPETSKSSVPAGTRQPSGKRRPSKCKDIKAESDPKGIRPKSNTRPKSSRNGKRGRLGKKKKNSDDKTLGIQAAEPTMAFISGIGWHVATSCLDMSDVVCVKATSDSDSSDEDSVLDEANRILQSNARKIQSHAKSLLSNPYSIPLQIDTSNNMRDAQHTPSPRFVQVKTKTASPNKELSPYLKEDNFRPMNLDMTHVTMGLHSERSSQTPKSISPSKELTSTPRISVSDELSDAINREILIGKLTPIPESPSLMAHTLNAVKNFDADIQQEVLIRLGYKPTSLTINESTEVPFINIENMPITDKNMLLDEKPLTRQKFMQKQSREYVNDFNEDETKNEDETIDEVIDEILSSTCSSTFSTLTSNKPGRSRNSTLTEADQNVLRKLQNKDSSPFHARAGLDAKAVESLEGSSLENTNPDLLKVFHADDFRMGQKMKAMIDAGADGDKIQAMLDIDNQYLNTGQDQKQLEKIVSSFKKLELSAKGSSRSNPKRNNPPSRDVDLTPEVSTSEPFIKNKPPSGRPKSASGTIGKAKGKFTEIKVSSPTHHNSGRDQTETENVSTSPKDDFLANDMIFPGGVDLDPDELNHTWETSSLHGSLRSASACTTDSSHSIDDDTIQWKRGNVLGRGAFGTVWCGLTNEGELIAVKQIELNGSEMDKAEREYDKVQEEVELLKTLTHRNIVGYLGTSLEDGIVSIFMQFVPGGSIASILARFGALDETVFGRYTRQILEGVEYLHGNEVIHRDIKGGNVMLMPNGVIKLIDFGCAKRLCFNLSMSQSQILKSMKGTPYWMAPEVVNETGHGKKSDIWSIGCTIFEMATRKPPWADMNPMAAIFAIGSDRPVPELPDTFSEEARNFVSKCLIKDQNKRPSATALLRHSFTSKKRYNKKSQ